MLKMTVLSFFISLAVLSMISYEVTAERCAPTKFKMVPVVKVLSLWRPVAYCQDGSRANPCCGIGKCNSICRNCTGGCRKARTNEPEVAMDLSTVASRQNLMEMLNEGDGRILVEDAINPTMISEVEVISLVAPDQQTPEQRYIGRPHIGQGWGGVSHRPYIGGFGYPYGGGFGRPSGGRPWW